MSFDPGNFLYQIHCSATPVRMSCFANIFKCAESINLQSCLAMIVLFPLREIRIPSIFVRFL